MSDASESAEAGREVKIPIDPKKQIQSLLNQMAELQRRHADERSQLEAIIMTQQETLDAMGKELGVKQEKTQNREQRRATNSKKKGKKGG